MTSSTATAHGRAMRSLLRRTRTRAASKLRRDGRCLLILIVCLQAASAYAAEPDDTVREIGDRRELFVDDWLIESLDGVTLKLHSARPENIAVPLDQPWAGPTTGFTSVFQDGDVYRCYYSTDFSGQRPDYTSYAESKDGIHWTLPKLGLFEFEGSKENNIIWSGKGMYDFNAFRDDNPAAPADQRYKAIGGGPIRLFVSPDAIHWQQLQDEPVLPGWNDSQNLAFWDPLRSEYVAYAREFLMIDNVAVRHIRTATSPDFVHWSDSRPIDIGTAPYEQLYTNAVTPYFRAPHIYVGMPMRFVEARKPYAEHPYPGVSDGVLITSRDGVQFSRRFLESFIEPDIGKENWTDRTNLPTRGVVQTGAAEMSVYWVEHFRHPTVRLRRGSLRLDGFASLTAPPDGGTMTTRPLRFAGRRLEINFRTSAPGAVRVAVLDADGQEISGFGLADCAEIYGNEIAHTVRWTAGDDVSALAGRTVRLRFELRDADVYSLKFSE